MRFRGFLYGLGMPQCGKNFQVSHSVIFNGLEGMRIGNNVFISNNTILIVSYGIFIYDNVIIGPSCVFSSNNHIYSNGSFREGKGEGNPIIIGKNSWIASNCTILAGSIIPEKSIIAAGAVYNKKNINELCSMSIYGGVPAKFIKLFEI
jgi:maltose O-acetyltransferase